jgi:hemerythrin superfamily protein
MGHEGYDRVMDAITMLKDDHRSVEVLFKKFEKAGDRAFTLKRTLVDAIIEELSQHAAIEEELFYPATRATVPGVDDIVLESIEEHHIVKWVLSEVERMDPHEEAFDAKVTVLIENVRHHVKEEEGDYFPKVRKELGRKALSELGDAMGAAKVTAPTRPHPRSPSSPPGNIAANNAAGMVDRVEGKVSDLAAEGAAALRAVVDRMSGTRSHALSNDRQKAASGGKRTTSMAKEAANKVVKAGGKTTRKSARPASKVGRSPKRRKVAAKAH